MSDTWRIIPVCGNLYEASESSQIRRADNQRLLTPVSMPEGYHKVSLCCDGKKRDYLVHRLVLMAFEPLEDYAGWQVNHRDGHKSNNTRANLEWVSAKQNMRHAIDVLGVPIGKHNQGAGNPQAKLEEADALAIYASPLDLDVLAKTYGVVELTIRRIKTGQSWRSVTRASQ